VTGLTNGTTYTFQVAAVNAARTGGYSARSSEVTPRTVPGAPTSVTTEVNSSGGVIVSWTAPTDNGGAVITDYMVQSCISTTCTNFVRTPESALTTQTVTGLTKGTAYTFKVAAKNVAGFGAYSTASSPAVTPRSAPGAPTDIVAVPGNQKLDVTWKAPAVTNGSAITDYIINVCDGANCQLVSDAVSTATSISISSLANGTEYVVRVAAVNAAGTGDYGVSAKTTPRTVPDAPTGVLSVVDNTGGVDVSWTAPTNTGGNAISDYTVQSCISSTCTTFTRSASTSTSV
jgi:hypothetical protein